MNTMKFFDQVIRDTENALFPSMAEAVSLARSSISPSVLLTDKGEVGLARLAEIWCSCHPAGSMLILEGNGMPMLAELLAQVHAHLILHPQHDPIGLAIYAELQYMVDEILQGDWFD